MNELMRGFRPEFLCALRCKSNLLLNRCFSGEVHDAYDGYSRSKHMKKQYVEMVCRDGSLKKIPNGLVDNTLEFLGDQLVGRIMKMTNDFDWTLEGFAERAQKRLIERNRRRQIVTAESIERLGLDLAIAHMICDIGGRVQFVGNDHWFQRYNNSSSDLPRLYCGDLKLETIDASGTTIVYEGFEFFSELTDLRCLRLRRCVHVDDHCMQLVGLVTKSHLEILDVSECPRLTANGLTTLTELKSLRRLFVGGNTTMEDKELACLLLEDYLPNVYIDGVDYLGELPEEPRRRVLALEAAASVNLLTAREESSVSPEDSDSVTQSKLSHHATV